MELLKLLKQEGMRGWAHKDILSVISALLYERQRTLVNVDTYLRVFRHLPRITSPASRQL